MEKDKPPDVILGSTIESSKVLSKDEIKQLIKSSVRKLKIEKFSNSEYKPEIFLNNFSSNKIELFKELSKIGVISGSTGLKLYGYLERETNDIDLIIDQGTYAKIKSKFKIHGHDMYDTRPDIDSKGYIYYGSYKVDVFVKFDVGDYVTYNDIKISTLTDIIYHKSKLIDQRSKDQSDFITICNCINSNKLFDLQIRDIEKNNIGNLWHKILLFLKFQPRNLEKYK